MADVIAFYRAGDEYGELSNFAAYPIFVRGKRWPTSEHFSQAQKFAGTPHEEEIRRAKKPHLAAEMGRDRVRGAAGRLTRSSASHVGGPMLALLLALGFASDPDREFDRQAEALEHAAREGIVDGDELWLRAAVIRHGLGQDRRAAAGLDTREVAHRGDPGHVAALFWSRRVLLATEDERLAHAERYLKEHARHGRRDHRVLAEATVGTILWRRACPRGDADLDCLTVQLRVAVYADHSDRSRSERPLELKKKKQPAIPRQYREMSKVCSMVAPGGIMTVHPRDERLAARARRHLERAERLAREGEMPDESRDEVAAALALVAVYRLDPRLWEYLALTRPYPLRFAPDLWADKRTRVAQAREVAPSRRRLVEFLRAVAERSAELREQYVALLRDEAAARLPALHMRARLVEALVVQELGRAAIPAGLASEADAMAFCAGFAPQVAAAEEALVQAWSRGVAAGTRYAWDRVAERCGGLLTHRYPDEWPANAEFFAAPAPAVPGWIGVQFEAP